MVDETSAGAVVYRETDRGRRFLLLHYQAGHWGFVKGHMEPGESLEETLRREALEEAGLTDLEIVDGFRERVTYTYRRDGAPSEKEVFFFLAETRQSVEAVVAPDEHQDLVWLPYEEALDRVTFDNARRTLEAAEEHLRGEGRGKG